MYPTDDDDDQDTPETVDATDSGDDQDTPETVADNSEAAADDDDSGVVEKSPYEQATDLSGVNAARANARRMGTASLIGQGIANIVNPLNPMANNQAFSQMRQQANNQVGMAEQARQDQIKNYMLAQQQKQSQLAADERNPDTPRAASLREALKKSFPEIVENMDEDQFNNLSPMDMRSLTQAFSAGNMGLVKKEIAAQRTDANAQANADRKLRSDAIAQQRQDALDAKNSAMQQKNYTDTYDKILGSRAPQDVQQARIAEKNIDSANELISQFKDPNNMPSNMVSMLTEEIGKIAQGGVPPEGLHNTINPVTVESRWKDLLQKTSGKPTGAQVGAFIGMYKNYLNGLAQVNHDHVANFVRSTFNSRKSAMGPELAQQFQEENSQYFPTQQFAGNAAPQQGGQVPAQPAGIGLSGTAQADNGPQKIMAPDGSVMVVPAGSVQKYLSKGGKLVQ